MPLNVREYTYQFGEASMIVWFQMYGIPMDRLEEGMALVRERTAESMKKYDEHDLAPAILNPLELGYDAATDRATRDLLFEDGRVRDFDCIVDASVRNVEGAAFASRMTTPFEDFLMRLRNHMGANEEPVER